MTTGSLREQTNEQTTGDLLALDWNVVFRKIPCGANSLMAMELGCDYRDLGFILTML